MINIETKRLQKVGDSIAVILPNKWLREFYLEKGDLVDLVVMKGAIVVIDRSADFKEDNIKAELETAQRLWDEKEDRQHTRWLNALTPEERVQLRKNWEARQEASKAETKCLKRKNPESQKLE